MADRRTLKVSLENEQSRLNTKFSTSTCDNLLDCVLV